MINNTVINHHKTFIMSQNDSSLTPTATIGSKIFDHSVNSGKNIALSPYSLASALTALHVASNNETHDLIQNFVGVSSDKLLKHISEIEVSLNENFNIKTLNMILLRNDLKIKQNYIDTLGDMFDFNTFGAKDDEESLAVVNYVNHLVNETTYGQIPSILKEKDIDPTTIMVIINILHFKASWASKFNPSFTSKRAFNCDENNLIDTMFKGASEQMFYEDETYKMLELPFENNVFVLGIVLPNEHDTPQMKFSDIVENINNLHKTHIDQIALPKFKVEKELDLEESLKANNLGPLFQNCDLTNMLDPQYANDINVSKVIQKISFEINEDGGEASASTVIIINQRCTSIQEPVTFIANRKFRHYLRHVPTNTILIIDTFDGLQK